jgi:hypothetical protein
LWLVACKCHVRRKSAMAVWQLHGIRVNPASQNCFRARRRTVGKARSPLLSRGRASNHHLSSEGRAVRITEPSGCNTRKSPEADAAAGTGCFEVFATVRSRAPLLLTSGEALRAAARASRDFAFSICSRRSSREFEIAQDGGLLRLFRRELFHRFAQTCLHLLMCGTQRLQRIPVLLDFHFHVRVIFFELSHARMGGGFGSCGFGQP